MTTSVLTFITRRQTSRRRNAASFFFLAPSFLLTAHGPKPTSSLSPRPTTRSPIIPRMVMVGPSSGGLRAGDAPHGQPREWPWRDEDDDSWPTRRVGTVALVGGHGRRSSLVPLLAGGDPTGNGGGDAGANNDADDAPVDMSLVEREVAVSARSKLDWRTVRSAIGLEDPPSPSLHSAAAASASASASSRGESSSQSSSSGIETTEKDDVASLSGVIGVGGGEWKVALSSGAACFLLSYVLLHSYVLSGAIFVAVIFLASRDPLEEDGAAGAAARIIGRTTLQSIEASRPKVRAVARAAVGDVDSELGDLRSRVTRLEEENAGLRTWIDRRNAVDEALPRYTVGELKGLAREGGLTVGGTKAQLLMRLVEGGVVVLEQ